MILNPTDVRLRIHKEISKLSMKSRYVLLKKTLQAVEVPATKRTAKEIDEEIHCLNLTDLRRITNNVIVSIGIHQKNQMLKLAEKLVYKTSKQKKKDEKELTKLEKTWEKYPTHISRKHVLKVYALQEKLK